MVTHDIDIVGKAAGSGSQRVSGSIRIASGDLNVDARIQTIYRAADLEVYELLTGEKWKGSKGAGA